MALKIGTNPVSLTSHGGTDVIGLDQGGRPWAYTGKDLKTDTSPASYEFYIEPEVTHIENEIRPFSGSGDDFGYSINVYGGAVFSGWWLSEFTGGTAPSETWYGAIYRNDAYDGTYEGYVENPKNRDKKGSYFGIINTIGNGRLYDRKDVSFTSTTTGTLQNPYTTTTTYDGTGASYYSATLWGGGLETYGHTALTTADSLQITPNNASFGRDTYDTAVPYGAGYGLALCTQASDGYLQYSDNFMRIVPWNGYYNDTQATEFLNANGKPYGMSTMVDIYGISPNGTEYWPEPDGTTGVKSQCHFNPMASHGRIFTVCSTNQWSEQEQRFRYNDYFGAVTITDLRGNILKQLHGSHFQPNGIDEASTGPAYYFGRGITVYDGHLYVLVDPLNEISGRDVIMKFDLSGNYTGRFAEVQENSYNNGVTSSETSPPSLAGTPILRSGNGYIYVIYKAPSSLSESQVHVFDSDLNAIKVILVSYADFQAADLQQFKSMGKMAFLSDLHQDYSTNGNNIDRVGRVYGFDLNQAAIPARDYTDAFCYGTGLISDKSGAI